MTKLRHVVLTEEERSELEQLIHSGNASARTQTRARILLLTDRSCGEKRTDKAVAEAVMCCTTSVRNVRRKYLNIDMKTALYDKGWPGAAPTFTGENEAQLIALACSPPPAGRVRWTLRLLASKMIELDHVEYVSHVTVGEKLKKTNFTLSR